MLKTLCILALALWAEAQYLHISSPVIGQAEPGAMGTIFLQGGGAQRVAPKSPVMNYRERYARDVRAISSPIPVESSVHTTPNTILVYPHGSVQAFGTGSPSYSLPIESSHKIYTSMGHTSYPIITTPMVTAYHTTPRIESSVPLVTSYVTGSANQPVAASYLIESASEPSPTVVYKSAIAAKPVVAKYESTEEYGERETPVPYGFAFETEDANNTKIGREESSDGNTVTGSYSLYDASGIARIVRYVADENGFRATVQTNEPGTITSNPADVQIISSAVGSSY